MQSARRNATCDAEGSVTVAVRVRPFRCEWQPLIENCATLILSLCSEAEVASGEDDQCVRGVGNSVVAIHPHTDEQRQYAD